MATDVSTVRDAATIVRDLHEALRNAEHLRAREIALRGAEEFPDDAELAKAARILAPPTVTRRGIPANPASGLDTIWLKEHGAEYLGKWVALDQGRLLGAADELDVLLAKHNVPKECLVTRLV